MQMEFLCLLILALLFPMQQIGQWVSKSQQVELNILVGYSLILFLFLGFFLVGFRDAKIARDLIYLAFLPTVFFGAWRLKNRLGGHHLTVFLPAIAIGLLSIIALGFINRFAWDDYSHWMPMAKQLLETSDLPTLANYKVNIAQPFYPRGLAVLAFLGHGLSVEFNEGLLVFLTILFVLLLVSHFSRWLLDAQVSPDKGQAFVFSLCFGLLLINIFSLRMYFSAYADLPFAISACLLATVLAKICLSEDRQCDRSDVVFVLALSFLLPQIKNYGHYLVLLMAFCCLPFLIRDILTGKADKNWTGKLLVLLSASVLVGFLSIQLWQMVLAERGIDYVQRLMPASQWNIDILPTILGSAVHKLIDNPLFYILPLIAVFWQRPFKLNVSRVEDRRMVFALLILGANFVLVIAFYVASLSPGEAAGAHSFQRYMFPGILFLNLLAAQRLYLRLNARRLKPHLVLLVIVALGLAGQAREFEASNYQGDEEPYRQIISTVEELQNIEKVQFVFAGNTDLYLPRIIFLLPSHIPGSWALDHDIERLTTLPFEEQALTGWADGSSHLCLIGDIRKSWGNYEKLAILFKQYEQRCHSLQTLIEALF